MIEFVPNDVTELKVATRALIESALGRKIADGDPLWLFCNSLLSIIVQQRALINDAANQNLLAYARGLSLEKIGELVGITRRTASAAICTVEVTLSAERSKTTVIKSGTRFNAGDEVHFEIAEDVIFMSGETVKTARAICQSTGVIGNGYKIGELRNIVDYQPYLKTIINITESEGGSDIETDDELRERIRIAPESFSVAGSKGAYEFWTRNYSTQISDCYCETPAPGYVDVYFLMEKGTIPQAEMIHAVSEYLSSDKIRPLTDFVTVKSPSVVTFDIDLKYYVSLEDKTRAQMIIEAAEKAVDEFILWQKSKLGRDLNPTELYYRMRQAGVKRAVISQPEYLKILPNEIAVCENINVQYGGLEEH